MRAIFVAIAFAVAGCGGGGGGGGGGGTPSQPSPPVTSASLAGGIYATPQNVSLTSSRPATIYYTVNGEAPSIGGANTRSGPSPRVFVMLDDTTLLQFFAVDAAGIQEAVKSETYVIAGGAATGPGDVQNYSALTVGNSWSTRVTSQPAVGAPVVFSDVTSVSGTRIINGVTAFVVTDANPDNTHQAQDDYRLKSSNGVVFLGNDDATDTLTPRLLPQQLALFASQAGTRFVQISRSGVDYGQDLDFDGKNERADVDSTVTVQGQESVTVPAGTFPAAVKIRTDLALTVTLSASGTKVAGTVAQTEWLAAGIGFVKSVVATTVSGSTTTDTEELVSAILAAPFLGTASELVAGASPTALAVGDFNGNGKLDLAVANQGSASASFTDSSVSMLLGDGAGAFGGLPGFAAGPFAVSVASGDFNGDGKPDLALANWSGPDVTVALGNGDGTFAAPAHLGLILSTNPSGVATADFNGDGKLDIAVVQRFGFSNSTPGFVSVFLGNGDGTFGPRADFAAGGGSSSITVGDFNLDGRPDLALTNPLPGTVSILLGNGSGGFAAPFDYSVIDNPAALAVADLNADGKPDLAVATNASVVNNASVVILLGNGDGTFGTATPYVVDPILGANLASIAVADFNRDGKLDVAVTNAEPGIRNNTVSVLLGDGAGALGVQRYFAPLGGQPAALAVADFNADGKPDLAVAHSGGVSILLNTGP